MRTEEAVLAGMLQVFGWPPERDTGYPTLNFRIFPHYFQGKSRQHNDSVATAFPKSPSIIICHLLQIEPYVIRHSWQRC